MATTKQDIRRALRRAGVVATISESWDGEATEIELAADDLLWIDGDCTTLVETHRAHPLVRQEAYAELINRVACGVRSMTPAERYEHGLD